MELRSPEKTLEIPPPDADLPHEELSPPADASGRGDQGEKKGEWLSPGAGAGALGSPTAAAAAALAEAAGAAETSIQKKMRRAERFGMPVQLSEEEKRSTRAERFGTAPSLPGKSEEQKRKERAERFGLPGHPNADEEEKKKARLARFAQGNKTNSDEEEKRKARAIRFSQTTSTATSDIDVTIKSDQENSAVVGKATGEA